MLLEEIISFDVKFLKVFGFRWDSEAVNPLNCMSSLLIGAAYYVSLYFSKRSATPIKTNIDDGLLVSLSTFRFWSFSLCWAFHRFASLFYHRQRRRLLLNKVTELDELLAIERAFLGQQEAKARIIFKGTFVFYLIEITVAEGLYFAYFYYRQTNASMGIYLWFVNFSIFLVCENMKIIYAFLHVIHLRVDLMSQLMKRKTPPKTISLIYLKMLDIIRMFNSCFGLCLLLELTRLFINVISYVYFFALQFLWQMELQMRMFYAETFLRILPLNCITILIIFKCGRIKSQASCLFSNQQHSEGSNQL